MSLYVREGHGGLDEWTDEMDLHETAEHFSGAHKSERESQR